MSDIQTAIDKERDRIRTHVNGWLEGAQVRKNSPTPDERMKKYNAAQQSGFIMAYKNVLDILFDDSDKTLYKCKCRQ